VLVAASLELKAEKQSAHSDYVRSVAFSPDGKTIVSGSNDETIKVWDSGTSTAGTHPPDSPLDTPTPTPIQRV
jgi:WD40 repeat protein